MHAIQSKHLPLISGGHAPVSAASPWLMVALFLWEAPHCLMHTFEFINYLSNLYEGGCENVDPKDKVGQFLVCWG